jgi:hypothetical protein
MPQAHPHPQPTEGLSEWDEQWLLSLRLVRVKAKRKKRSIMAIIPAAIRISLIVSIALQFTI